MADLGALIGRQMPRNTDYAIYSNNGVTPARVCIWSKDRRISGVAEADDLGEAHRAAVREYLIESREGN